MILLLLLLQGVTSYSYDWVRLHRCATVADLLQVVNDYKENFPCLDCREHLQSLLSMHPFPLEEVKTPQDVRLWTWFTHNLVNKRLDKPWTSFDIMSQYNELQVGEPQWSAAEEEHWSGSSDRCTFESGVFMYK